MSFLENIKRKEQEKRQSAAWSLAVGHLSRFIRQYLRKAEKGSALVITPDLLRVGDALLDRLTLFLDGETVTATPLSLSDPKAKDGGCVMLQSTNGVIYHLLWDGGSPAVQDHWKIVHVDDRARSDKVPSDEASARAGLESRIEALSEKSLDEALDNLFGLAASRHSSTIGSTAGSDSPRRVVAFSLVDKRLRVRAS